MHEYYNYARYSWILNENEWEWVQDIPSITTATNKLINTNAWTIDPWQNNIAHVYCQTNTDQDISISYSIDGIGLV